jgi:hypothetical protein
MVLRTIHASRGWWNSWIVQDIRKVRLQGSWVGTGTGSFSGSWLVHRQRSRGGREGRFPSGHGTITRSLITGKAPSMSRSLTRICHDRRFLHQGRELPGYCVSPRYIYYASSSVFLHYCGEPHLKPRVIFYLQIPQMSFPGGKNNREFDNAFYNHFRHIIKKIAIKA